MDDVDWAPGEEIIIASTDVDPDQAEKFTISAVSGRIVTLDGTLSYDHYAAIDTYGTEEIEIRAEVGLLTRNVVYRGDPETSATNQYGAHIMLHAPGDEASVGRIEYAEFFDVGQAFQLGRYPIHFHMMGTMHKSYVRGNAVHQSYNRGTTIHGVHYLRVLHNVYYDCMGHTVFVEDAIETKNRVEYNLVVNPKPSFSLLNTDATPACFWITHPDNIFVGNHAAGGPRYGFWFDLQEHPIGPSARTDVCPVSEKLGEFRDNVAHSVGRYGLRIFHHHSPRTYPCKSVSASNPVITAYYKDFVGYKNGRNGVIGGEMGAVVFQNIKVADNVLAGIEIEKDVNSGEGVGYVDGALVVGRTTANSATFNANPHGIITPRTDRWWVKNVRFYNFDFGTAAAFGSCSHCFSPPSTDTDARTVKFEGISYDEATVPVKVRYQFPYRAIFYDVDGSLTGRGAGAWATSDWTHNRAWADDCELVDEYGGLLCHPGVTVRRLHIY